jgi:hypothetical protein
MQCYLTGTILQMAEQLLTLTKRFNNSKEYFLGMTILEDKIPIL